MKSFYVNAAFLVDEEGLYVDVDLEKTNAALNTLFHEIEQHGYQVQSVTPVTSGVGNYKWGHVGDTKQNKLTLGRGPAGGYGYGFGYGYTSGFMVMAKRIEKAA